MRVGAHFSAAGAKYYPDKETYERVMNAAIKRAKLKAARKKVWRDWYIE